MIVLPTAAALFAALLQAGPAQRPPGESETAVRRLDVADFPTARAWVHFAAGPGHALRRLTPADLAATVDSGDVRVLEVRVEPPPPRTVILALVGSGPSITSRSRLDQAAREFTARAVPGDRVVALVPGPERPLTFGPGHPSRVLPAARQVLGDSTVTGGWEVLDGAAGALRGEAEPQVIVLLPSGARPTAPALARLARRVAAAQGTLTVAGGAASADRAQALTALGAIDAGSDIAAAVRRALMVAPADSVAADEVVLSLPEAEDGATLTLALSVRPRIAGLDSAAVAAAIPFQALRPGRLMVGGPAPLARAPNPAVLGFFVSIGIAALALAGLVVARRARAE